MEQSLFSEAAQELARKVYVLMLYQTLLGRDPENSFVIEEARTQPLRALFRGFVESSEFTDAVIRPIRDGGRLRHDLAAPGPTRQQRDWIASLLVLDPHDENAIRSATTWRGFFEALMRTPGFLAERDQGGATRNDEPASPRPYKNPAPAGYVLGRIERYDRSGVSGWAMRINCGGAPDDGAPLDLACFQDGEPLGRVVRGKYRPDVAEILGGDGICGFEMTFEPIPGEPTSAESRLVLVDVATETLVCESAMKVAGNLGVQALASGIQGKLAVVAKEVEDMQTLLAAITKTPNSGGL
jgi:hypothetical protein